jgi:hypothetical protein
VPFAREQEGGLGEASRLLEEGLQLLDERSREVDALIASAEQRAQEITAEAERRAEEITAEAERKRLELEREVAELQAEVERLRAERAAAPAVPVVDAAEATRPEAAEIEPEIEPIDPDAPRWGRRSSAVVAPQAVRRSSRPRWLSWLPLLVLVAA